MTAHVLSGKGKHGFDDKHRGQLIVLTGVTYTVPTTARHHLIHVHRTHDGRWSRVSNRGNPSPWSGVHLREHFRVSSSRSRSIPTERVQQLARGSVSPLTICRAEAKRVLHAQSSLDASELQYLLEYYSLVREGKTNYISTCAFHDITGQHPQEPVDFFKVYVDEFVAEHPSKKRKVNDA